MKKVLVMMVVLAVTTAFAQQAAPQQTPPPAGAQQQTPPAGTQPQAQPGQAQPAAPAQPQQKKEIKDQAEYNAYMSALKQTDPAAKAAAFEAFLQQYPNTVMKPEALEAVMAAYSEANNPLKSVEAANALLQADPTNLRALAVLAYNNRVAGQTGQNPQGVALAAKYGETGLQALQTKPRPEGMDDAAYEKFKTQLSAIFNGAVGVNALQTKDYATAQKALRAAVDVSPNQEFLLVYPLALAYLQAPQPDYLNGLFFVARAASLAPTQAPQMQQQLAKYGQSQYNKYHGGPDGWDQVVAAANANPVPPAGFTIKPAPTPAEQAHNLLQSTPVDKMDFASFELILSSGTPEDQQALWNQIKDKPIKMQGFLLNATANKLMIAGTLDANQAKKPDIELQLTAALTRADLAALKEGQTITFEGTPISYNNTPAPAVAGAGQTPPGTAAAAAATPNFVMVMSKGTLYVKPPAAKTPARRPGTRKPPAR